MIMFFSEIKLSKTDNFMEVKKYSVSNGILSLKSSFIFSKYFDT